MALTTTMLQVFFKFQTRRDLDIWIFGLKLFLFGRDCIYLIWHKHSSIRLLTIQEFGTERQVDNIEKQQILEFESQLAAASSKQLITGRFFWVFLVNLSIPFLEDTPQTLEDLRELVFDMAHVIVERTGLIPAILPGTGHIAAISHQVRVDDGIGTDLFSGLKSLPS